MGILCTFSIVLNLKVLKKTVYLSFSDWLISLSTIPSTSIHAVAKGKISIFFKKDLIYLFLERGRGKEKEMQRNINVWLPLVCPNWGPGP